MKIQFNQPQYSEVNNIPVCTIKDIVLYNSDCFDVFPLIPTESIDAIICDLPYGITQAKWDSVLPLDKLWAEYKRVIKPKGAIVLTASQPFTSMLVMSNPDMFRYEWIWEKSKASNFLSAKQQPLKAHENILVFSKKVANYYPQKTQGTPYNRGTRAAKNRNPVVYSDIPNYDTHVIKSEDGLRYPRSVQYFANSKSEGKHHPTQKPIALMEYLVRTYTNAGDTVLDNTMGSGTTGVACLNTGRGFIGIEKEKEYFDAAIRRMI